MPKFNGTNGQTNFISGTDEDDTIIGGNEIDFISGGGGRDYIYGGAGNDFLNGGDGNDVLFGGRGDDRLFGGEGNDRLIGGKGKDVLQGEGGNDKLKLTDGDTGSGGSGADKFIWKVKAEQTVNISDFDALEGDQMILKGASTLDWEAIDYDNYTAVVFENGAAVNFYGYEAGEIIENASDFGL